MISWLRYGRHFRTGMNGRLSETREYLFRFLSGDLHVQGIRAEIHVIAPTNFAACTDRDLLEGTLVVPQIKNTLADEMGQIHDAVNTVRVSEPESVIRKRPT